MARDSRRARSGPHAPRRDRSRCLTATRAGRRVFSGASTVPARRWGPVLHSVKRSWVAPVSAAVLLVSTAGVAVAQGVTGSQGPDRLRGTNQADTFQAYAGDDRVRAFAGDD